MIINFISTPDNYCINGVRVAYEKVKKKSIDDMIKSQKEEKEKLELLHGGPHYYELSMETSHTALNSLSSDHF